MLKWWVHQTSNSAYRTHSNRRICERSPLTPWVGSSSRMTSTLELSAAPELLRQVWVRGATPSSTHSCKLICRFGQPWSIIAVRRPFVSEASSKRIPKAFWSCQRTCEPMLHQEGRSTKWFLVLWPGMLMRRAFDSPACQKPLVLHRASKLFCSLEHWSLYKKQICLSGCWLFEWFLERSSGLHSYWDTCR